MSLLRITRPSARLRPRRWAWALLLVALLLAGCVSSSPAPGPTQSQTPAPTFAAIPTTLPSAKPSPLPRPTPAPPPSPTPCPTPSPTPAPRIAHVLLISVDGLRPEALARAAAPNIERLWKNGAYSWQAQTILPSATLPAHAAMLTGLPPEVTGVTWNNWSSGQPYITFTTVLGLAHQAGLPTAAFIGKGKLRALLPAGSVDSFTVGDGDYSIAEAAATYIVAERPALVFVHLPGVDAAGHASGWLSPEQVQAVERADAAVGRLVRALEEAGIAGSTAILLAADHGGHGVAHGSDIAADTTIVWILYGPGIAPGKELAETIHIYDTAATVAYALGLPVPQGWWGRPVREAFGEPPPR